jgi:hypothetical protein
MTSEIRAAAVRVFSRGLVTGGWAAAKRSSARGRGANVVLVIAALLFAAARCSLPLEFHSYRACHETPATRIHDPGLVTGEYLGDDHEQHFIFLSDRQTDRRNTIDLTRVNRACPLVSSANTADQPSPFGDRWDASEGRLHP